LFNTAKTLEKRNKVSIDAQAYRYQSIYELDNSKGETAEKMSDREIIRKRFQGNDE
jgi:hypothetical protein